MLYETDQSTTFIDLFSGSGGMTQGFVSAGARPLLAIEHDPSTASTFAANHPNVRLIQDDIRNVDTEDVLACLNLAPGQLTALIAGPPCQGFSESNRRTRTFENPRNHLYTEVLRFTEVIQPAWVVLENVEGLRTIAGGSILRNIVSGFQNLGYRTDIRLLNAVWYGVPQIRRRLFVLASRHGHDIPGVPITHGDGLLKPVSVTEAIGDLPILSNGNADDILPYPPDTTLSSYQAQMGSLQRSLGYITGNTVTKNSPLVIERYSYIPQGGNWRDIPEHLMSNYKDHTRCHTGIYHRLSPNIPSRVIGNYRKNMMVHPIHDRGLSVREAARLQSFPDHYEFKGKTESRQQQVSDAVPPLLAKAVAAALLSSSSL